jgi:hypothetical protein
MKRRIFGAMAIALTALSAAATRPQDAPLTMTFNANTVVVDGATPGGDVVIYGMSQIYQPIKPLIRHSEGVRKASNPGGEMRCTVGAVAPASVWAAVDQATGRFVVASPGKINYQTSNLGTNAYVRNGAGDVYKIDFPHTLVDVLLVRPGVGQWSMRAVKGGPNDEVTSASGSVSVVPAKMANLIGGAQSAPSTLRPGDVVIGLEPLLKDTNDHAQELLHPADPDTGCGRTAAPGPDPSE